ncbi:AsnC family transcriptional regulator [Streptomyces sp. NPDC003077]|uniref:Lrp/AsnC family transcriptional regulator n=1 Tax=Streptomyces sp. NPDC003077 TaxID=3154443 RepID=UPI0033AE2A4D
MKTDGFDEVDRQLVHALQLDGRAPFSRIAAVLGVSDQTVARRYSRLRTSGLITVRGLTDPLRLGEVEWLVRVQCTPDAAAAVAEALARRPDTAWVSLMSGGTEITAVCRATGSGQSDALLLQKLPRTPSVVGVTAHCVLHEFFSGPQGLVMKLGALSDEQVESLRGPVPTAPRGGPGADGALGEAVVLEGDGPTTKDPGAPAEPGTPATRGTPPEPGDPEPPAPGFPDPAQPPALSPADGRLLDVLAQDGRTGFAELAGATGWSQSTVRRRMAELRASGVLYYDVDCDSRIFGMGVMVALWLSVAPADLAEAGEALAAHPEVAFACATTGPNNLFASLVCPDVRSLYTYLTTRVAALPGVRHMESSPLIRRVKGAGPIGSASPATRPVISPLAKSPATPSARPSPTGRRR